MTWLRLLFPLALAACTTTAAQPYRAPSGEQWQIVGENTATGGVRISINGEPVVSGQLGVFSGAGEFTGEYQGHPVRASCFTQADWTGYRSRCQVFVNNEYAADLKF